jgi:tetratricopeptide (TPR) repeat protein
MPARRSLSYLWWCLLIIGATVAAYGPVYRAGLIWNDEDYVTPPALTPLSGLARIWFSLGATQQYYPALHSAFWIQHRLWGDAPWGYHLANVLLHALAACLVGLVLRRLKVPGAWFGGLVFALHPIAVESVAWVSEQKNTLSAVFYLGSMLAYLRFDRARSGPAARPGDAPSARPAYLLATGLFLLAILSKSVVATLPAALLVILWWQRGRLSWRDVLPLLPWFAATAVDGALTAWFERHYLGAEGADFNLNLAQRFLLAGRIVWFYLGKVLWPAHLIFIYPRWNIPVAPTWQYGAPLAVLAVLAALALLARRRRGPLAAALFFVGSLVPTLGFLSVFGFLFSYVADHWVYLPALGLIALASAGWGHWDEREGVARRGALLRPARVAAAALLILLGLLTWRQAGMYRDVETLYRATLARNPAAWMAHNNLGILLEQQGRTDEAIAHYREVLRLRPEFPEGHNNLAVSLANARQAEAAVAEYREAIRLNPRYRDAHLNLANLLRDAGQLEPALAEYAEAIRIDPTSAPAHNNLGIAYAQAGRLPAAVAECREAIRLQPDYAEAHYDLAQTLRREHQTAEAIGEYEAALKLNPALVNARNNLGIVLAGLGHLSDAMTQFVTVLQLQPDNAEAHFNAGVILRAVGRTKEAQAQFDEAQRLRALQR